MTEPSQELIRDFVLNSHFNLEKVKALLTENPSLLNVNYQWEDGSWESPIQAGAHVGNTAIVEFFLSQGVPLDIITAAVLGRKDDVARFLAADQDNIQAVGAHSIPLMTHAAYSGDTELAQMILDAGGKAGINSALFSAISKGHLAMVNWLLANGASDLTIKNWQEKTPLMIAEELGHQQIVDVLKAHGAA